MCIGKRQINFKGELKSWKKEIDRKRFKFLTNMYLSTQDPMQIAFVQKGFILKPKPIRIQNELVTQTSTLTTYLITLFYTRL